MKFHLTKPHEPFADIESLFRENYASMYRFAYTMLHDREASRDVVQAVFLQLMDRPVAIEAATAGAYLRVLTRNRCLNFMAQQQAERRRELLYTAETEPSLVPTDVQERRWEAICDFIDRQLTPQTARVLRLCYAESMTYREVAAELDISVAAVNKHIVQALRKLREHFKNAEQ